MTLKPRTEVEQQNTWDLTKLYRTEGEWETDFITVQSRIENIKNLKGTLATSAKSLASATQEIYDLSKSVEKIFCYTQLLADQDTSNAKNQGLWQRAYGLYSKYLASSAFFTPELLAIPDEVFHKYLQDPTLKPYARALNETVRAKPHTLDTEKEELLAQASEALYSARTIFSQLDNADLKFGSVTEDGIDKELTHGSYQVFLLSPNRTVRKEAYEKYMAGYERHKNTASATYTASVKKDVFLAKARKHKSALTMSLFPDHVDLSVYQNLIGVVSKRISALHNYYKLRAKILKLDKCESYDMSVPLVKDLKLSFPYQDATKLIRDSLRPLGDEYTTPLYKGLSEDRWVDRYENIGKRSGAYQSGWYGAPPFILMNYKEDSIDSVYTLTHEAGHAMHTYFTNKNQPYQDHDYPIFSAEVASTFNEQLLSHYLLTEKYTDPKIQAYIINHQINEINGTFFRQTLFAEFEMIVHELAEKNEPLTVDVYRSIYSNLLKKYGGEYVNETPLSNLNGLRIPHFYSAFYVYKYATGISAAIALSQKVLKEGSVAKDRYLKFLKSGCTKPPIELLKEAGVDLNSPAPIEATIDQFEYLTNELGKRL